MHAMAPIIRLEASARCHCRLPKKRANHCNDSEAYYILLAGTNDDFCNGLNGKYKTNFTVWPF